MDTDITYEERLLLSSLSCKYNSHNNLPSNVKFSSAFNYILKEYRKSIAYKLDMNIDKIIALPKNEKLLTCTLVMLSETIKKGNQLLPTALSKKYRDVKFNKEFNFIVKQVCYIFESIINNSILHIEWDITSNVYQYCPFKVKLCRHDFILTTSDGTEVGTGEIKPWNASDESVEVDRSRIAESLKK
jgi:hypothetical protein